MRKHLLAAAVLVAFTASLHAQSQGKSWELEIQGGYNTSSNSLEEGWLTRTGVSYGFTDALRLNLDLGVWEGSIKRTGDGDHLWTLMVSPEYVVILSDKDQVCGAVGLGALRSESRTLDLAGKPLPMDGATKLAAQAALGYRHFFNKMIGLSAQATYTHFKLNENYNPLDASVGVVVRF
jgi:opacity protein-like surface antigen